MKNLFVSVVLVLAAFALCAVANLQLPPPIFIKGICYLGAVLSIGIGCERFVVALKQLC